MAVLQSSQCFGGFVGLQKRRFYGNKNVKTVPLKWSSSVVLTKMCANSYPIILPLNILNHSQVLVCHPSLFREKLKVFMTNSAGSALSLWLIQPPIPIPGWMCHDWWKITPKLFKGLCTDDIENWSFDLSALHTPPWFKQDNSNTNVNAESEIEAVINIGWFQHPVALSLWLWCCWRMKDICFDFLMVNSYNRAEWMKIRWFLHSSICHILTHQENVCFNTSWDFLGSLIFSLKNKIRGHLMNTNWHY